jgi:hypothetical protein
MAERTTEPAEEIAESIGRISSEAGRLLHDEFDQMRHELEDRARTGAVGLGMLAGAAGLGAGAFATGTGALVSLLGRAMPRGVASAVVAGTYGAGAIWLVTEGRRRLKAVEP